jgi:hypothetical protein
MVHAILGARRGNPDAGAEHNQRKRSNRKFHNTEHNEASSSRIYCKATCHLYLNLNKIPGKANVFRESRRRYFSSLLTT